MKEGGGAGGAVDVLCCPPWGDGSWDVDATSPTATHVEQDLDACSKRGLSIKYPERCIELSASSDTALRSNVQDGISSGDGSWLMSLVLKLFCNPRADDKAAQLRIKSFSSSNHRTSGISGGLKCNRKYLGE